MRNNDRQPYNRFERYLTRTGLGCLGLVALLYGTDPIDVAAYDTLTAPAAVSSHWITGGDDEPIGDMPQCDVMPLPHRVAQSTEAGRVGTGRQDTYIYQLDPQTPCFAAMTNQSGGITTIYPEDEFRILCDAGTNRLRLQVTWLEDSGFIGNMPMDPYADQQLAQANPGLEVCAG